MIDFDAIVAKAQSFETVKDARGWIRSIISDLVELKRSPGGSAIYKRLLNRIVEPFSGKGKGDFKKEIESYVSEQEYKRTQETFDEATDDDGRTELDTSNDGIILATQANMVKVLLNNKFIEFKYETFTNRQMFSFLKNPLWNEGLEVGRIDIGYPVLHRITRLKINRWYFVDEHIAELKLYLHHFFPTERSWFELKDALDVVTKRNQFNLYQDGLDNGLPEWDSIDRSDVLYRYAGVSDREWSMIIWKLLFLGMVARCYEPGYDFRGNVILEGDENIGKTWLAKSIGFQGERYYSAFEFTKNGSNYESTRQLEGKIVIELADKGGLDNKTSDQIKAFLTQTQDMNRRMHHDNVESIKRTGIILITCNESESYLKSGNEDTRFYPVRCNGMINVEAIISELPQIYAQAKHLWEIGITPRPTEPEMELQQKYIKTRQIKPTYFYYVLSAIKLHRTQVGSSDGLTGGFSMEEMLNWMRGNDWFILKSDEQHEKAIAKVLKSHFSFNNGSKRIYTETGKRKDSQQIRRWRYVAKNGLDFDTYLDDLDD